MIISVHQPQFLPWMGYFNKVLHSDVFVWLNTVQFRPRHDHNRARIRRAEQWIWATLPVHASRTTNIEDVKLADPKWRERIVKTIEHSYKKTPFFDACWPPLLDALSRAENTLDSVNYETFTTVMAFLNSSRVIVVRASELPLSSTDATGRLVEICKHLGASGYLSGRGGRDYMRLEEFEHARIDVIFQDFDFNRVVYPQVGKTTIPGLSIIDCLFNVGPQRARSLACESWCPYHALA